MPCFEYAASRLQIQSAIYRRHAAFSSHAFWEQSWEQQDGLFGTVSDRKSGSVGFRIGVKVAI
jgi:hypothetical protein